MQRQVTDLLSSEQGRSIIEKATQVKREPEAERPLDPSIKAALEAAKAGAFRQKKLPQVKLTIAALTGKNAQAEETKNPTGGTDRDLRRIVADCRQAAL